jgi:hypothetical protein
MEVIPFFHFPLDNTAPSEYKHHFSHGQHKPLDKMATVISTWLTEAT